MKTLLTSAVVLLVTFAAVHAQSPRLELRRVGNQWVLDYHPSPQQGASMLHFSTDLLALFNDHSQILDVPANSTPFPLDVTSYFGGQRGFFAVTEFPGLTAADFVEREPDIDAPPPPWFIEPLGETGAIADGQSITIHFRLLDYATLLPLSVSGSVSLDVKTQGGQPPPFTVTLNPASLPLINGTVNGTITVTGSGDFSTLRVAVMSVNINEAAGATVSSPNNRTAATASAGATGNSLAQLPATAEEVRRKEPGGPGGYAAPSGVWQHPLLATTAVVAGSFGEWRPSNDRDTAGRPHYGIDMTTGDGTPVYPMARGIVSQADNDQMVVNHGNGSASRYVHVVPNWMVGKIVEKTTVIGSTNLTDNHLHLEVMPAGVPTDYWSKRGNTHPGQRVDPASINQSIDPPLVTASNYSGTLKLNALYLWNKAPKSTAFGDTRGIRCDPGAGYLVAALVNLKGTHTLIPATVTFSSEDATSRALVERSTFTFDGETDLMRLFQSTTESDPNFGYVRRVGNKMPKPYEYQMWFKWNTTSYLAALDGPRQARVTITNRLGGPPLTSTWKFGPELLPLGSQAVDPSAPDGSTFTLTAKSYMGPFPQLDYVGPIPPAVQPQDKITFTFEGAPSWEAVFLESGGQTLSKTFFSDRTGIKEEMLQVRVKKKASADPPTVSETLTIKATSGVFPSIAHTVPVQILPDFALIPAGIFTMGSTSGDFDSDAPPVSVNVSAFYMAKYEVTKALWDEVWAWGASNGYTDLPVGTGKAANHPVHTILWQDMLKWCNARSQKERLTPCYTVSGAIYKTGSSDAVACDWNAGGYRLPTEAEWEKAARGGLSGQRFPWGNTISHSQANYYVYLDYYPTRNHLSYDVSPTPYYHPSYETGPQPYTSPVGSFAISAANGYGLHDMVGNIAESCWDWYSDSYYLDGASDPRGPISGQYRVCRGGNFRLFALVCRSAARWYWPDQANYETGFRLARSSVP